MKIQVRFFARLREDYPDAPSELELAADACVRDAWLAATGNVQPPANVLCALNMEYVDWNHAVADGDEVAFFPPVTGG